MEPKFSSPELTPESAPQSPEQPQGPERTFEVPPATPEHREAVPQETVQQPPVQQPVPITLPTPVPVPPPADDQATATEDDSPQVAADDDLIEKEWVDKAKKIIAETKDDPHQREKQVGQLQADYLKKRYGKELGTSS